MRTISRDNHFAIRDMRRGATNSFYVLLFGGIGLLIVLGVILSRMGPAAQTEDKPPSGTAGAEAAHQGPMLFCAAELHEAVEKIAADYQRECGVTPLIQFGGSNTLLSTIAASRTGDLFLAADDSYIRQAGEKGLIRETFPIGTMRVVIAVERGNPKHIAGVKDLLRDDVVTALGSPDHTAIGDLVRQLLRKAGLWGQLEKQVTAHGVFTTTVSEAANDVKIKSADATIVWDTTVKRYPTLDAIDAKELAEGLGHIELAVLKSSEQPTSALKFARYITARDKGLPVLSGYGYKVIDGDDWSAVPQLNFYIGSVNRRALEPIIDAFQRREGVQINTSYNGCGILTSTMRTIVAGRLKIGFPDVYMACDVYYLNTVKDLFQEAVNVSDTEVVIVVPRGNPQHIKTVRDLTLPGLRLSVGQCEQCTIGVLTKQLLESEGLFDDVKKNVQTETATSAMLIPTVTTHSVDATLAYATDARGEAERIDVIRIHSPAAKAVQPFAIARSSHQKNLARRLFQEIARSKDKFEAAGFHWRLGGAALPAGSAPDSRPKARAPIDAAPDTPAAPR